MNLSGYFLDTDAADGRGFIRFSGIQCFTVRLIRVVRV